MAVVFFQPQGNLPGGVAWMERRGNDWVLLGQHPYAEKDLAAKRKNSGCQWRDLSSDKIPEILVPDGEENDNPTYTALRWMREAAELRVVARRLHEPFWSADDKEVLSFYALGDDDNVVTGYRWLSGRLEPVWRCVQFGRDGLAGRELVLSFYRFEKGRPQLYRRCIGNLPFYASPAGVAVMRPLSELGRVEARLSEAKTSYALTAQLGVMRIASFEMSFPYFMDRFSRGFFAVPGEFGPRFKIHVPKDDQDVYLAQFGKARSNKEEHAIWASPKNENDLETHARQVLIALAREDVFALLELLPGVGPKTKLVHGNLTAKANAANEPWTKQAGVSDEAESMTPEETAGFLDELPERLLERGGEATRSNADGLTQVAVKMFPANPTGRGATLLCRYRPEVERNAWRVVEIELSWDASK
jgi:hypothetical protein